jgi:WD40 repeat protein
VRTLRGHTDTANNTIFTPEGKLLSCSRDKTIKIWDPAADPEVRQVVPACSMQADPALFAPGGQLLAFSSRGMVSLLTGPVRAITLVDCGPDRRPPGTMYPWSAAGRILPALSSALFGGGTGRSDRTLAGNARGTVALAFSHDGQRLASGGRTGEVKTWDIARLAEIAAYRGHNGEITALAISPDGRRVASAHEPPEYAGERFQAVGPPPTSIPAVIKVWEAVSGKEQFTLDGHVAGVNQLAFSPDGRRLASASYHETGIWDMASGKRLRELNQSEFQSGTSDALAFSADGSLLATAGNQIVQLWDVASGHSVAVFHGHKFGKLSVAISPDQSRLASAAGQEVKIWDAGSGLEALSLPLPPTSPNEWAPAVAALAWSLDGQRLRAALRNGAVVEWDATRGQVSAKSQDDACQ